MEDRTYDVLTVQALDEGWVKNGTKESSMPPLNLPLIHATVTPMLVLPLTVVEVYKVEKVGGGQATRAPWR